MIAQIHYRSPFTALILGLAAAILLAGLPRLPERLFIQAGDLDSFLVDGETAQLRNFFGFHAPESDGSMRFRWTSGEGSFVVRNGARLGAPLLLTLRLCGCRTGNATAPRLQLRVNGETLAETSATAHWGMWRRYSLLLPPRDPPYSPDLLIEMLSDRIPNEASGIPLGIAFGHAILAPLSGSLYAYTTLVACMLGLLTGGLVLLARAQGRSISNALLAGLLGLGLVVAQGSLYRHQSLPVEVLAFGLLLSVGLALALGGSAGLTLTLTFLLSALILLPQILGTWMLDDAYISFRYAHNALNGYGFVFNPGERVEGYTNFLWTVLFIPILNVNAHPALTSQIVTLLLALATAGLTWAGARRLIRCRSALAAVTLLIASTSYVLYTARGSGMETALFTLLLCAGTLAYVTQDERSPTNDEGSPSSFVVRRSLFVGALLALAAMTRPEGALVAALCGLHLLITSWCSGRIVWRRLSSLAVGFLAVFGPYYLWRFSYYGYPLPNTFYAKVGGTAAQALRGLGYAAEFTRSQAPLIAIALLGLLPIPRQPTENQELSTGDRRRSIASRLSVLGSPSSFLWSLVGLYTLYIIAVGGDHFPFYRFFVPILPPLALLAALALDRLSRVLPRPFGALAPALMISAGIGWQIPQLYASRTLNTDGRVWSENSVVEKNREIGLWLRAYTPPDTLIATGIAGALPYYAERPVLDTLGLNDLHIAHLDRPMIGQGVAGSEKTDNDYILSRRPAYIPHNTSGLLKADPRFAASYVRMIVRGPEGRGVWLYRRSDLKPPDMTLDTYVERAP